MEDKALKELKKEEAELTKCLRCGMPSYSDMDEHFGASKLAKWEKGAAQFMDRWRFLRQQLGLSLSIDSIRP